MEIKSSYTTFEQSKNLFNKGFDIISKQSYDSTQGIGNVPLYMVYKDYSLLHKTNPDVYKDEIVFESVTPNSSKFGSVENFYNGSNKILPTYHAPEQWQVVEWLLQNHGIFVRINPTIIEYNKSKDDIKWCFDVFNLQTYLKNGKVWGAEHKGIYSNNTYYETPQEAYSAAFDYILNNNLI
jgi:hypothetical protein